LKLFVGIQKQRSALAVYESFLVRDVDHSVDVKMFITIIKIVKNVFCEKDSKLLKTLINSLFAPPTCTRQDCLVLSVLAV